MSKSNDLKDMLPYWKTIEANTVGSYSFTPNSSKPTKPAPEPLQLGPIVLWGIVLWFCLAALGAI